MIISRTPYRLSFFGGGTDYPAWYLKHGGQVLSTSIDKYCYISLRTLPPFFEHRIRVVYSRIELCQTFEEIRHPSVREVLRFAECGEGLEIHHDGDLPARSGIGSSSSFTVGLLHALYAYKGLMPSKKQLAQESIHIEQEMIQETVGSQDQCAAAYGGLNHIIFTPEGDVEVRPLTLSPARHEELKEHLMLFYSGIQRTASEVAQTFLSDIEAKGQLLRTMHSMVDRGISILQGNGDITAFGELLHEAWMAKRGLGSGVSNSVVDEIYARARKAGAIGGKISGAGGGGFMLLFVPPNERTRVREALGEFLHVPFKFDRHGSQIVFFDPDVDDYTLAVRDRTGRAFRSFKELNALKNA